MGGSYSNVDINLEPRVRDTLPFGMIPVMVEKKKKQGESPLALKYIFK